MHLQLLFFQEKNPTHQLPIPKTTHRLWKTLGPRVPWTWISPTKVNPKEASITGAIGGIYLTLLFRGLKTPVRTGSGGPPFAASIVYTPGGRKKKKFCAVGGGKKVHFGTPQKTHGSHGGRRHCLVRGSKIWIMNGIKSAFCFSLLTKTGDPMMLSTRFWYTSPGKLTWNPRPNRKIPNLRAINFGGTPACLLRFCMRIYSTNCPH